MDIKTINIDRNLTPENAKELGYEFGGNVIYDSEAPKEAMQEIVNKVESGEYKLGKSLSEADNLFVGLYKKIL